MHAATIGQEAQLWPTDRAMRRIVEILPIATQKLHVQQVLNGEPSISCRYLTRATKLCRRQRLTICAINYSGRASELGGVIDLVDRRRSSLSRPERPPFSS